MKNPMLYSADQLKNWDTLTKVKTESGEWWLPARPIGRPSIKARFILAIGVFTGKYDALIWT